MSLGNHPRSYSSKTDLIFLIIENVRMHIMVALSPVEERSRDHEGMPGGSAASDCHIQGGTAIRRVSMGS